MITETRRRPRDLFPREKEIMELTIKGMTGKEIASELNLSYHTIRTYKSQIYDKLDVLNMNGAIVKYMENKG